ncbi:transketolase, A protein [Syntrophotalea carbinolica DSM 2380]|uniref:Transketolase, A protein n=1 Tax=Syntrophotalea carbinolica (strain DSM 2380 / NBRC 103641 / GraBd1) TaxID=338963 RepID=Q3A101_SYNC1|nr:transketolase [Syntrophotalea carbinolica]ABA89956.1 transketolase, A protein [Syntrophotalea carbinolica DSM 2380]
MLSEQAVQKLEQTARELRVDILKMLHQSQSGHTGGSLSAIDIMTVLFFQQMKHDASRPDWAERDRFVLSKGHAAPALYACLARAGYFPKEDLATLRQLGSHLQGHPDMRKTPGVEVCTGSLGQGLSQAVGLAMANKVAGRDTRVYALLGDGELQEGQIWEATMSAAHYGLSNLCIVVDCNGLQIDGFTEDVMNVGPVAAKFAAFNMHVIEADGHDVASLGQAFAAAEVSDRPTVIVAKTVKGKGVSIFENKAKYHGVAPSDEELQVALQVLGA